MTVMGHDCLHPDAQCKTGLSFILLMLENESVRPLLVDCGSMCLPAG